MTLVPGGRILESAMRQFTVVTSILIQVAAVATVAPVALAQFPTYRSIIVLADTQNIIRERDPEFAAMINWIVRNKHSENIDAVLHLGDLIAAGGNVSTAFAQGDCGPGYPARENSQCKGCTDRIECVEACDADTPGCVAQCPSDPESKQVKKPGCFFIGDICAGCQRSVEAIKSQWAFFNSAWSALRDPSDPIPYMFAMGNHENVGSPTNDEIKDSAAGNADVLGYGDYYGASHWQAPEFQDLFDRPGNDNPARDRGFEYLGSFVEQVDIGIPSLWDRVLSQAWRFRLGESPGPQMWINVVGHGPSRNTIGETPAIDWAQAVIRCESTANLDVPCNPNDPAILLSHRQLIHHTSAAGTELWEQIIHEQPAIYKGRVLMAMQGHLAPQNHLKAVGLGTPPAQGMRTLNFIFNQQDVRKEDPDALPHPILRNERRWWMAAIRVHLTGSGIRDIEVVRINPVASNPLDELRITKTFPGTFYKRDWDLDSVNNWDDLCPYHLSVSGGPDRDNDGWGDSCDSCPDVPDVTQKDFDRDGIGDACDTDLDEDSLLNELDPCPYHANTLPLPDGNNDPKTGPNGDANRDLIPNECQCADVNQDGAITAIDVSGMAMCAVGNLTPEHDLADFDGDQVCTGLDLSGTARIVSGDIPAHEARCLARPEGGPVQ